MSRPAAKALKATPLVLLAVLVAAALPRGAVGSTKILVSIAPVADLVRRVAGEDAAVTGLFPPGEHPRLSDPAPDALQEAPRSRLFVKVGAGLEGRAGRLAAQAASPETTLLDLSTGLSLIKEARAVEVERKIFSAALGYDEIPGSAGTNPYFWLDPVLVKSLADRIASSLASLWPQKEEGFRQRAALLKGKLDLLDADIRLSLEKVRDRRFFTFSGAWSYFLRRYGLEESPAAAVTPGGGPARRSLQGTARRLRAQGAGAVFTDLTFPAGPAAAAARRAGVPLIVLEPFGGPGRGGYFDMMRHNLRLIEEGLH